MRFASFGLGDTSYPKYNWAHRKLYNRLIQLGAQPVCDRGESDEQHPEGYVNTIIASAGFFFHFLMHRLMLPVKLRMQQDLCHHCTYGAYLTIPKYRRIFPTMVDETAPTSP